MEKVIFPIVVLIVLAVHRAPAQTSDKTITRPLGDINGDGKPEYALETIIYGVSANAKEIKIVSGGRTLLVLPGRGYGGDTADGYQIIGKQVVVWVGDWHNEISKWKPHYYNFYWYQWETSQHKYIQMREGFTKKVYSYDQAKKIMPRLAHNPGDAVVASTAPTFGRQAFQLVSRKYHKTPLNVRTEYTPYYCKHNEVIFCWVNVPQQSTYFNVVVTFYRNGRVNIQMADEQ